MRPRQNPLISRPRAIPRKTIMKRHKVSANDAVEDYQDLIRGVDCKPFPSLEGFRNMQRMLKPRKPKIGEVKTEEVIDARIMRKLG